jgi:hypothetical protein
MSEENEHHTNVINIEDEFEGAQKIRQFKHIGPICAIDEVDASNVDLDHFRHNYLKANRPLVIRNALRTFDCGTAFANWSLDYLKDKCGSNDVYVRRNTLSNEYKTGRAYMVQESKFSAYVDDLVKSNSTSVNSYLAVQNLKKAFTQVADELRLPPFVEKLHAGPFLWISRAGHYEYTHMDPDDNVLMVIRGRKMVRLYGCDVYAMHPNKLGSKGTLLAFLFYLFVYKLHNLLLFITHI